MPRSTRGYGACSRLAAVVGQARAVRKSGRERTYLLMNEPGPHGSDPSSTPGLTARRSAHLERWAAGSDSGVGDRENGDGPRVMAKKEYNRDAPLPTSGRRCRRVADYLARTIRTSLTPSSARLRLAYSPTAAAL